MNDFNNITLGELDEDTSNKLKGDAIGNTMYSEAFVLKTLIELSDLKWSKDLEDKLCVLWDMTEETDVCQYLSDKSFVSIACTLLNQHEDNRRFIEIIIGICANLYCNEAIRDENEHVISVVLNLFTQCEDPLVLIQVMRFLHALAYKTSTPIGYIDDSVVQYIDFILTNSTNADLLVITLKTLTCLTTDFKLDATLIKPSFFQSSTIAYNLINKNINWENRDLILTAKYFELNSNICAYINNEAYPAMSGIKVEIKSDFFVLFLVLVIDFLTFYSENCNLLPINDSIEFYFQALSYIFQTLNVNYNKQIVGLLAKQLQILISSDSKHIEHFSEFLCYFLSLNECIDDVDLFKIYKHVLIVLQKSRFEYDFDYLSNLNKILLIEN